MHAALAAANVSEAAALQSTGYNGALNRVIAKRHHVEPKTNPAHVSDRCKVTCMHIFLLCSFGKYIHSAGGRLVTMTST